MLKKIFLITFLAILNSFSSVVFAQTNIAELLVRNYDILQKNDFQNMPFIIDYSIEILKKSPNSIADYYTVGFVSATNCCETNEMITKFKKMHEKYFSSIDDLTSDTVEKIILADLLYCGFSINKMTETEIMISQELGKKILKAIASNYSKKDCSALAMLFLATNSSSNEIIETCEKFKELYPDHGSIPLVNAKILIEKYLFNAETKDYLKYIEEIKKIIDIYKDIESPFGKYKLITDVYASIIQTYLELDKLDSAKEYLELIKKEAPNFYRLPQIKSEVDVYMLNHGIKN